LEKAIPPAETVARRNGPLFAKHALRVVVLVGVQ